MGIIPSRNSSLKFLSIFTQFRYMAYKELVSDYERTRRITPNQHVEFVTILEKRLARGIRIQSDYFESKRSDAVSPRT